jgi:hypothetical protein
MIDAHHGIVQSTAGTSYFVRVLSTLDRSKLVGACVGLAAARRARARSPPRRAAPRGHSCLPAPAARSQRVGGAAPALARAGRGAAARGGLVHPGDAGAWRAMPPPPPLAPPAAPARRLRSHAPPASWAAAAAAAAAAARR